MPFITPQAPLPPDAKVYRVLVSVPREWQTIVDGLWLNGIYPADFEDVGIGPDAAADEMQNLYGEYLVSDLCGAMALCFAAIANTPYDELTEGQQALFNSFNDALESFNAGGGNPDGQPGGGSAGDLINGPCDNDNLFALVTQYTDLLNTIIEDLLERTVGITNTTELVAEIADNYAGVSELIATVLDVGDWLLDNVRQSYPAGYTSVVRDEIRCELFCEVLDNNCEFSFDLATEYFREKASLPLPGTGATTAQYTETLANLLDGSQVVFGVSYVVMMWINNAFSMAGINERTLARLTAGFYNDSDPDWETVCDDCPQDWEVELDFEVASFSPQVVTQFSSWVAGQGWVADTLSGPLQSFNTAQITIPSVPGAADTLYTEMEVTFTVNGQRSDGAANEFNYRFNGGSFAGESLEPGTYTRTVSMPGQMTSIDDVSSVTGGGGGARPSPDNIIKKIVFRGTGTEPVFNP